MYVLVRTKSSSSFTFFDTSSSMEIYKETPTAEVVDFGSQIKADNKTTFRNVAEILRKGLSSKTYF